MRSPPSVCLSVYPPVCLLPFYLRNRLTVDLELLHVSWVMAIALRGVKVEVVGQANAVGPTSMEGSFSSVSEIRLLE